VSTQIRLLCENSGLGEDHKFAAIFTETGTPTNVIGPAYIVPNVTTQVNVELGGIAAPELIGVAIRCASGTMYATPASSGIISTICYMSQGAFAYFPCKSSVTSLPAVLPITTTTAYEVWAYGVATA
jgi:hypothetical protein